MDKVEVIGTPGMDLASLAGASMQPLPSLFARLMANLMGDAHCHKEGMSFWAGIFTKRQCQAPFLLEIDEKGAGRIAVHPADLDFVIHCIAKTIPQLQLPCVSTLIATPKPM